MSDEPQRPEGAEAEDLSSRVESHDGLRLIKAFLSIPSARGRAAVIEFAETLAKRDAPDKN